MSGALRVLVVTNMYPTTADPVFGKFVERQVDSLRELGVDIHVAIVAAGRGQVDYVLGRRRVAAELRQFNPDIIHAHFGYTGLSAVGFGRPLVLSLCGDDLNGEPTGGGAITIKSRVGILLTRLVSRFADRVIVMNRAMRDAVPDTVRSRTEVMPYGVNDRLFSPGSTQEARERLRLPLGDRVICFANSGRQVTKRAQLAASTVDTLRARGLPVRLLVADGSVPPDEMPWYYRASDCFVMTSEREGSPSVVREALACGIPVVSVKVGDVADIIRLPEQGRVSGAAPEELATAVEEVLHAAPGVRRSLLDASLTAAATAERLRALYQHLTVQGR